MSRRYCSVVLTLLVALAVGFAAGCTNGLPDSSTKGAVTLKVASLRGPTTMGLVSMIADPTAFLGEGIDASFAVESLADVVTTALVSGEVDIALIPANMAAILHARTGGEIQVAAINTLNVLHVVSKGITLNSVADLVGQTVWSIGQSATPQATLETILAAHGLSEQVAVEYLSDATEVASRLAGATVGIAILPEPYATVVAANDEAIEVGFDLGLAFQMVTGSPVVTGVTVVRTAYAQAHPEIVSQFLVASTASALATNATPVMSGELVAAQGITPDAATAAAAIPRCGIVIITGREAQTAINDYLTTLHTFNPSLVGGVVPDESFYWSP